MYIALRGIDFSVVENASGARNFFGEGFPFHRWWKFAGLTFRGCGFVAKTTTLEPRLGRDGQVGNMPLRDDGITPVEYRPACIKVNFWHGVTLNSVGLSGPGASALFDTGLWQERREPFWLSFMSVKETLDERLAELTAFVTLLAKHLPDFHTGVGLELNFSCPNTGLAASYADSFISEVHLVCDIVGELGIPLRVKLSPLTPVPEALFACNHPACDAVTMGNTLPWHAIPLHLRRRFFGSEVSPLDHLGGGGLSGWPLLPLIESWIWEIRQCGFTKPIWASGGIFTREAISRVYEAQASGIQLGTVAITRPVRMRGLIRYGHRIF